MFATFMLMNEDKQRTGSVKRIYLNPMFVVCLGLLFFLWFILYFHECYLLQTDVIEVMQNQSVKSKWTAWGEAEYTTYFPETLLEFYQFMTTDIVSVVKWSVMTLFAKIYT